MSIITTHPAELEYASEWLKNDREVVLAAGTLRHASGELKNDKAFVRGFIERHSGEIYCVSENLKKDIDLLLIVVRDNQWAVFDTNPQLAENADFISRAARVSGAVLRHTMLPLDKSTVLDAVRTFPYIINELPYFTLDHEDIVLTALRAYDNPGGLLCFGRREYVEKKYKNHPRIMAALAGDDIPDDPPPAGGGKGGCFIS